MTQLVARISQDLVDELDRLVAQGLFESRSDAVREAIARLVDRCRRDEIGRQIVEGYLRIPQTEDEVDWGDDQTREMVEEEPW